MSKVHVKIGDFYSEWIELDELGGRLAVDLLEQGASREELLEAIEERRPRRDTPAVSDPE